MTPEGQRFFIALDDSTTLRIAGDKEGAADLRLTAERDFIAAIHRRIDERENPQMELGV